MKNKISLMCFFLIAFSPITNADMFGGDTFKLSEMYILMKKEYKVVIDQLKEAKAASTSMREIYDISGEMYDEYKFIENFSVENDIRRITRDFEGLTGLTGLYEVDNEGKFKILRREINARFKNNEKEKTAVLNKISELERLEALKQKKIEEAANAGAGRLNDKNLSSSIASSNALIAAMELSKQQKEIKENLKTQEFVSDMKAHEDGFINFLEKNKDN